MTPAYPLRIDSASELVLMQAGQEFRCSSVVYTPAGMSQMTDLTPEGMDLRTIATPAFITAATDRPLDTMAPVSLVAGGRQIPLSFVRSQSGKAVTDRIRIDEPDASHAAQEWGLHAVRAHSPS